MRVVQNSNNIIRVLKEIKIKPGISRIEISKDIGLDKSTVTVVANRLMDLGFIEETTESLTPYQGGRRPVGLKLKTGIGIILGLEIQTDYYFAILIDMTGKVYKTMEGPVKNVDTFFYTFLNIYKDVYNEIEELGLPLLGVGIGTSGMINPHKGIISDSNPLNIHEPENFYEEIKAFLQVPVFLDNDANCGCWAVLSDSKDKRPIDSLFVLGEFRQARVRADMTRVVAVGMGIVINERVHYGQEFSTGEYKSPSWQAPNKTQFSLSNEELNTLQSDRDIIVRIKEELASDIAFLTNMLNLTTITIGGSMSKYIDILEPQLQMAITDNWSYERPKKVNIQAAPMKEMTIAYGAAAMLLEHLFLTFETTSENPWSQKVGIDLFNSFTETISK